VSTHQLLKYQNKTFATVIISIRGKVGHKHKFCLRS
jgi:hypothetical protein